MKTWRKRDFPVSEIRRFLEPGPVVLVSSAWKGERNVMTMGWHMVMEFVPSLVACLVSGGNHSFEMIRRSRACVINVPTVDMASVVVGLGNCSGRDTDKFAKFGLTTTVAETVGAPLIAECHTSLECKLADGRMIDKYNLFVFEVVKAHAATRPKYPQTLHYRGDGMFMVAGRSLNLRSKFRPGML